MAKLTDRQVDILSQWSRMPLTEELNPLFLGRVKDAVREILKAHEPKPQGLPVGSKSQKASAELPA